MQGLATIIVAVLVVVFLPRLLSPYLKRPDVQARMVTRARLPAWLSLYALFSALLCEVLVGVIFFNVMAFSHSLVHPGLPFIVNEQIDHSSMDAFFDFLKFITSFIVAIPLGLITSNLLTWCIPALRRKEDKTFAGISGASFRESNTGLLKASLVILPITFVVALVCIIRS
jgi:hypothetical protein